MTPTERYQSDIHKKRILPDSAQLAVVNHTQTLYDELVSAVSGNPVRQYFARLSRRQEKPVTGFIPVGQRRQRQDLYR